MTSRAKRTKERTPMRVTFMRTGERRYAVQATPEGRPTVEMNPAPGYDALMPHDLQHFIVERALGIEGAIFGQLAAGGTAGTFHATAPSGSARQASRERRKQERKSTKLMSSQQADCARSERATYVCLHDWLSHSESATLRAQALKMQEGVAGLLLAMARDERNVYTPEMLARVRLEFFRLSKRWSALKVGESFSEAW